MLFYDNKAHKISQVTFNIPMKDGKEDYMSPWTFTSDDGRFEMDFVPVMDRAATSTTTTETETTTTSTKTETTTTSTTTETTTTSTTTETTTTSTTTTTPPTTTTVEFGDINLDGVLDANDASVLLTYYALSSTGYSGTLEDYITEELGCDTNLFESALNIYGVFGDMNGDDIVDANDASLVLTYYAISSTGYTGTIKDYLSEIGI